MKIGFEDSRFQGFEGLKFHAVHSALRPLTPWPLEPLYEFS